MKNNDLMMKGLDPISTPDIDRLVSEYEAKKKKIISFAAAIASSCICGEEGGVWRYFFDGYNEKERGKYDVFFDSKSSALSKLDAEYWDLAFKKCGIFDIVSDEKCGQWSKMIKDKVAPSFDKDRLIQTLIDMRLHINDFFSERVLEVYDYIQRYDDNGFFKKKIIFNTESYYGGLCSRKVGIVNDFRSVVSQINGGSKKSLIDTYQYIECQNIGEWFPVDTISFKRYAKTIHIAVDQSTIDRLNSILEYARKRTEGIKLLPALSTK